MKKSLFTAVAVGLGLTVNFWAQVPSYVPTNGLVGWWPFNGNAIDESGNGNNGTVNGATLTSDRFGNTGNAYSFDGVDDFIQISNSSSLNFTNGTINIWLNTSQSSFAALVEKLNYSNASNENWAININQNSISSITFFTKQNSNCTPGFGWLTNNIPTIMNNSNWHMITCVMSINNSYIYADGILINTIQSITFDSCPGDIQIARHWSNDPRRFSGILDDMGIWNRALTVCEIQDLYDSQLGSQSISAGMDQTICNGQNVILTASGGLNYQWNNNVVDSQAFSPNQTNYYSVQGIDSLGCAGSDIVLVTVLQNSASTLNETALDSYILNNQTYTQSGTYTQTIPAANGCDSLITLNLTLNFTGIENQETNALSIYPNPTKNHITIDNGNFAAMAGYSIKIENNNGQQVFQSAINQAQFYVDLSTWTGNGLYFVHLIDPQNNTVTVRKIVLQ